MSTATAIADVFNHVHQSYGDMARTDDLLADVAERIGNVLADAGLISRKSFAELTSMSGLMVYPDDTMPCGCSAGMCYCD